MTGLARSRITWFVCKDSCCTRLPRPKITTCEIFWFRSQSKINRARNRMSRVVSVVYYLRPVYCMKKNMRFWVIRLFWLFGQLIYCYRRAWKIMEFTKFDLFVSKLLTYVLTCFCAEHFTFIRLPEAAINAFAFSC